MARPTIAPALHAFVEHVIDYAGVFPPASLRLEEAIANYRRYIAGPDSWILNRFVIDASRADQLPHQWPVAVLGDENHPRASAIETKRAVAIANHTYCEVPIELLPDVKQAGGYAKLRCAGLAPEDVARYISRCAELDVALKFTAGLHAPLTYPGGLGFINVFTAALMAFSGGENAGLLSILNEQDPSAVDWTEHLKFRSYHLRCDTISRLRKSRVHSFGSCSFEEPVEGLKELGWV